jgi:hypothetical protein
MAPFLTYLTLFQSRTAAINLVLPLTGSATTAQRQLQTKLERLLGTKIDVRIDSVDLPLAQFLIQKKYLAKGGAKVPRKGTEKAERQPRYPNLYYEMEGEALRLVTASGEVRETLSAYCIDVWMSDPRLRSTVAVPTLRNVGELVELSVVLGFLSGQTYSWTSTGHLAARLRASTVDGTQPNPFVFGAELLVIIRQLLERDLLILNSLTKELVRAGASATVSRDEWAKVFPDVVRSALASAKARGAAPEVMREGKAFLQVLDDTGKRRERMTSAPGVLEHRLTPRLEWLTDLGVLSKQGLPRNGFEYRLSDGAAEFEKVSSELVERTISLEEATCLYWRACTKLGIVSPMKSCENSRRAIFEAYQMLKRPIGPLPIRDVCLVAACALENGDVESVVDELLAMSQQESHINLSGGRYQRSPEFVYIDDALLRKSLQ